MQQMEISIEANVRDAFHHKLPFGILYPVHVSIVHHYGYFFDAYLTSCVHLSIFDVNITKVV